MDLLEQKICYICDNEYMNFLCKPNVQGIALGYKIIKNFTTFEKCLAVFVSKKIPEMYLGHEGLIPKKYKGISTDVIEVGKFKRTILDYRIRPVLGGFSISNEIMNTAGSMACLVKDRQQNYYILSNNHAIAADNDAPLGSRIVQPAVSDGGNPNIDAVGILSKFIELKFGSGRRLPENFVDAAIAKVINKSLVSPIIDLVGAPQATIVPRIGMQVKKVGRTSEISIGVIQYLNSTITIETPKGNTLFKKQILADELVLAGDSGSLLLDINNNAVGLVMSAGEGLSAHNPINLVLGSLEVTLVTK